MNEAAIDETVAIEVGSFWRKNDARWRPLPGERWLVRVEGFTPLGRPILRRVDCEHEWVADLSHLLTAFDLTDRRTVVVFDHEPKRRDGRYPWRTKCAVCGWGDTFASEAEAEQRAERHDTDHRPDRDTYGMVGVSWADLLTALDHVALTGTLIPDNAVARLRYEVGEVVSNNGDPICAECGWERSHTRHHDHDLHNFHEYRLPVVGDYA